MTLPDWNKKLHGRTVHEASYLGVQMRITIKIGDEAEWRVSCHDNTFALEGFAAELPDAKLYCEVARRIICAVAWMDGLRDLHPDQQLEARAILDPLFDQARARKYDGT
jgi:hypothetical protein